MVANWCPAVRSKAATPAIRGCRESTQSARVFRHGGRRKEDRSVVDRSRLCFALCSAGTIVARSDRRHV